jgi:1,4-alpha-glucan branching enzyme
LNALQSSEPSLHEVDFDRTGFEWIDFHDVDHSIIAFMRKAKDPNNYVIFVLNFTPVPHRGYRLGVPEEVFYKEVMNSDSSSYGGSNMGNEGGVMAKPEGRAGFPCSIELTLPPLAVVVLKPQR